MLLWFRKRKPKPRTFQESIRRQNLGFLPSNLTVFTVVYRLETYRWIWWIYI